MKYLMSFPHEKHLENFCQKALYNILFNLFPTPKKKRLGKNLSYTLQKY